MKYSLLFFSLFFFFCFSSNLAAQVGINTTEPDESAYLEIAGSEKGLLPPRMNDTQRSTLDKLGESKGPANGLVIYNTSAQALQVNKGTKSSPNWVTLGEGGSTPLPENKFVWYYLPVTTITMVPTSEDGTVSINLLDRYNKLDSVMGLGYLRSQLEFVILSYDTNSFSSPQIVANPQNNNNLDILKYTPTSNGASEQSYLNIAVKITNKQ